jgi:hypothetical protein
MEDSSSVPEPDPIRTTQNDPILTFTAGIVGFILSVALLVAAEIASHRVILFAAAVLVSWGMTAIAAAIILPSSQRELINEGLYRAKNSMQACDRIFL